MTRVQPVPRMVSPATAGELAEIIRESRVSRQALRFVGSGTWLHGGGPFADAALISLRRFKEVLDYTPGDLVITVGAGITLRELETITADHNQMLAIAPYGSHDSTIGAVVATSAQAPLELDDLTIRDLVLGMRVVTGLGTITRTGGKVVKNVAGFDLVRLHTGAWGSLGAITEVSLRLHALPVHDQLLAGTPSQNIEDMLPALVRNRVPLPILVTASPAAPIRILARLSGNSRRVEALRELLVRLDIGDMTDESHATLSAMRSADPGATILRLRTAPSDAVPFFCAAREAFSHGTLAYSPLRGSMRVVLSEDVYRADSRVLQHTLTQFMRRAVALGSSYPISIAIDQWRRHHPPRTILEQRVKQALDPDNICNRLLAAELAHACCEEDTSAPPVTNGGREHVGD